MEKVAALPGVAARWFQYNDQFCLGRYDGENHQIGMVDVCMQPYPGADGAVRGNFPCLSGEKAGEKEPYDEAPAHSIKAVKTEYGNERRTSGWPRPQNHTAARQTMKPKGAQPE